MAIEIFLLHVLIPFFFFYSFVATTYSALEFHRAPFCQPCFAACAMETWKTNYSVGYRRMGRKIWMLFVCSVIVVHNVQCVYIYATHFLSSLILNFKDFQLHQECGAHKDLCCFSVTAAVLWGNSCVYK